MIGVFSGGVIYEYTQEENNYGLVEMGASGGGDGDVTILQDYDNLMQQMNKLDVSVLTSPNTTATALTPPTCGSDLVAGSNFTTSFEIPDRPDGVDDLINNGIQGNFPTGLTKVTDTQVTQGVTGADGSSITGLTLNVLPEDASNLPGNNTSGTGQAQGGGNNNPPKKDAATRLGSAKALVIGALSIAFFTQLC